MDFWLMDVQSTVTVNEKDVAFDYINTFYEESDAIKEAKLLSQDKNVLKVSVHHWILNEDGTREHVVNGDNTDVPYYFVNGNHKEMKKYIVDLEV